MSDDVLRTVRRATAVAVVSWAGLAGAVAGAEATFTSPGFEPSKMDDLGRLAVDWGSVSFRLEGVGLGTGAVAKVRGDKLEGGVPAAVAESDFGPARMCVTAYRAPVWPDGVDVLAVKVEDVSGKEQKVTLSLDLPAGARLGSRTVRWKNRAVLSLPADAPLKRVRREWGSDDDAASLVGWGKPAVECDPAFRNIRAGMGGLPIHYRFKLPAATAVQVVLGICESHHAPPGQRPLVCRVEGAPDQQVDPVGKWGRHQPGALAFEGRDANGDGDLDVTVMTPLDAADRNPILNAIWIFPAGNAVRLDQVIAGRMNAVALRYVDVGGPGDQALFEESRIECPLTLPAKGSRTLCFLAACNGASVPSPEEAAWTESSLRSAATAVWRDWK